jgi:hypothetical protein
VGLLFLCAPKRIIWSLAWLHQSKAGEKKWCYIKDRKIASSDQYGVAPFDANQKL